MSVTLQPYLIICYIESSAIRTRIVGLPIVGMLFGWYNFSNT
jgi:hypothetical protein